MTASAHTPSSSDPDPSPAAPPRGDRRAATRERILDAAFASFADVGIRATTMDRIATGAGVSRVWLYKNFPNRDAVVATVVARESERFAGILEAGLGDTAGAEAVMLESMALATDWLSSHELLQSLLRTEPESLLPFLTVGVGPLLARTVEIVTAHLVASGVAASVAALVAEAGCRLCMSLALTPHVTLDLDDPAVFDDFIRAVLVPALRGSGGA